ncbi:flippase [Halogeometricum sp. S1BR25-6]|uniref:Flippase n=1 Tax=Halogeometricum salsisoli TaxID=2950536 RepID=A0ABU2GJ42_9EURY|nr:flippase [Halogeometricum sp. S1BR25-6]MDS0300283.1 flippase [Halogeometricum sp. S1BR25-6]
MNIARSSVKLSVAHGGKAIITFGGIAFFANQLSPGELGVFFLFEALVGVLMIPADLGLRGAAEKRISEGDSPSEMLTTAVLLKALPLFVIVSGVLLFGSYINDYAGESVAVLLAVAIVGQELYQFGLQIVSAELRVGETAILRLAHKLIWFVVGYFFLASGFGVTGLIYGLLVGYAIPFVWAMIKRSTAFGRPSMEHVHSLTAYSRYNFVSAVSGYFYSWMDVLIIGWFLTSAHVGAYEVAWRVTGVVIIGSSAIAQTIFPQVSRWDAEEAIERIERIIPQAVTPSLIIAIPAFFGTLLFSREILTFVFDAEYATASLVLVVLMAEKILQAVHVITGRSLKATNHPELAARAAVVAITTNLILNVVLIQQYGLIGAAIATVVSFGINTAMCVNYLSRYLTVRIPWRELAWVVVSSVGMTLVLLGTESVAPVDSIFSLFGVIGFGAVVYAGFVLLSPSLRLKIAQSIRMVKSDGAAGEPVRGDD